MSQNSNKISKRFGDGPKMSIEFYPCSSSRVKEFLGKAESVGSAESETLAGLRARLREEVETMEAHMNSLDFEARTKLRNQQTLELRQEEEQSLLLELQAATRERTAGDLDIGTL